MSLATLPALVRPRLALLAPARSLAPPPAPAAAAAAVAASLPCRGLHTSLPLAAAPVNFDPNRKFPERKVFLVEQYRQVFDEAQMAVLVQFNSLTAAEMNRVRTELATVALAPPGHEAVAPDGSPLRPARLLVVRNGIAKWVARNHSNPHVRSLTHSFTGPMGIIHAGHFSPGYMGRVLNAVDRALGGRSVPAPKDGSAFPEEQVNLNYRFTPLVALLEGKRVPLHKARDLSKLPELKDLRAQILGVISAPGQKLAGALSQAAGGDLSLLLEARKRDLEGPPKDDATSA